jgi:hypothetical protein
MCALNSTTTTAKTNEFARHDYDNNNHNGNDGNDVRKSRVLRFEFAGALIEQVTAFANVHRYDDRKTYKEAWTAWLAHDEIAALMKTEVERLKVLGYKGDVADKLFKSGRYYFRGKTNKGNKGNKGSDDEFCPCAKACAKESLCKKYVLLNRKMLDEMDDHIECGLRSAEYTPAGGFADFCNTNAQSELYRSEVARLSELMPTGDAVHDKLKKTYKNRYFMLTKAAAAVSTAAIAAV